jgi:hypothetical protein
MCHNWMMLAAWRNLLGLISALLLVQSASFGFHQGFHAATAAVAGVSSPSSASLVADSALVAPDFDPVGEGCGLCQLYRTVSASRLIVPSQGFMPSAERHEVPQATGPPAMLASKVFSARAPPA